jgi:nitroimidazol reductase NimA-like FMN-containing flavoprotein (pyridoxamine 5'-phosphate oxidase superfamily)
MTFVDDDSDYRLGPRTTPTRKRERATGAAADVHAVLDEALICHVGVVVDGEPVVLPTIHTRVGRTLYLHGSSGSRLVSLARSTPGGVPVCVTVTLLDGIVLARSQFNHSMNYRSVVIRGQAEVVTDPQELAVALDAVVDHVVPGRSEESRPPDARELAATAVVRVPLVEVSLKRRSGPPGDDEADLSGPHWAGVVPVRMAFGEPLPAADLDTDRPVPEGVRDYRR